MYKQEPPFAVQVELSEGCNLYCDFCGLQGIRDIKEKDFKFMDPAVAKSIAAQIRDLEWNPRIEFAMHGEPTMNPNYIDIVKRFRKRLPRHHIMMTSNGGGLLRPPGIVESLTQLFDAGLNVFAFDAYEYVKIKDKIDAALFGDKAFGENGEEAFGFEVHRYPDEKEFSPHNRYGHTARMFIRIQDISVAEKGTHSSLNNHCGAGAPGLKEPLTARCAKPFRELSIRWNGDVAICCNDWRGVFKVGNVVNDGLQEVWHHERFNAARRFLMQGDRGSVSPCNVCDAKSYRVGLLPDKKGRQTLRAPNDKDRALVKEATKGKTLASVVIRPWEIKGRKRVQS
jgi:radical SAM protein with 4Fe4S-binding SPASM domain